MNKPSVIGSKVDVLPKTSPNNNTKKLVKKQEEKERARLEKEAEKERARLEKESEKEKARLEKIKLQASVTEKEKQNASIKIIKKIIKKETTPITDDQLIKDHVATFVFKKIEFQSLSNFWPCQVIIIDGENVFQYNCGETAFHGEKYRRLGKEANDAKRSKELLDYSVQFKTPTMTAVQAKKKGGKSGLALSTNEMECWSKLSLDVQREISNWKANNIPQVRLDLLNTGNRILVHSAMRTSEKDLPKKIWEGKATVNEKGDIVVLGGNWLGKIWMEVRDRISN